MFFDPPLLHSKYVNDVMEESGFWLQHMQQMTISVWFWYVTDLDGNGFWDPDEVKALFLKELDKMYTSGAAEDDMRERIEELERMREHVFKEADTNKDGLIRWWESGCQYILGILDFLYKVKKICIMW